MDHKIIYFLCTGNACRSQMAEGFAKEYLGEEWIVHSAGTYAHGINSHAVEAMKEIGIDISNHTSDIIDPDILHRATLVVTLCGDALDSCPIIPADVEHVHCSFDDPAGREWSEFQRVRDEISAWMKKLPTML